MAQIVNNKTPNKKKTINVFKLVRFIFILIVIFVLIGLLIFKLKGGKPVELDKNSRTLVIGKTNMIAVYEDKLAIMIPFDVSANKEETFGDIIKKKNYEELLDAVNKILPEKITEYKEIKGEVKLETKNKKNIPETNIDNKKIVLTSSLQSMFDSLYNEKTTANEINENIIVDILNANGKAGYAKKTGEKIKSELSMKYNAANYENFVEESSIILNDISKEKAQELVMALPEKYFKIKESTAVPTLANVVIILGKEDKISFGIDIIGKGNTATDAVNALKKAGYKNIKTAAPKAEPEESVIEYAPEDYYIAYKIGKVLNVQNLVEKGDLKNKINVNIK